MRIQVALSIFTGFVESLFFNGVLFGFPSLQFVLEKEGYFGYLCGNQSGASSNFTSSAASTCGEQEASFNLAFSCALASQYIFAFILGYILDKVGTWAHRCIATTLYTLGYTLLAVSSPDSSALLYPALTFIGISGFGLHSTNFQVANFTKTVRGTVVGLLDGLYDSAVLVFLLVKKGYDAGVSLYVMLSVLSSITIFLWIRTFFLLPKKRIPYSYLSHEFEYGWNEISCCEKTQEGKRFNETDVCGKEKAEKFVGKETFKSILKIPIFWTNLFFFSVTNLRVAFFSTSVLNWLRSFNNPDDLSKLTDDFGFILLFGVVAACLSGILTDTVKKIIKTKKTHIVNLSAPLSSTLATCTANIMLSAMALISSAHGAFIFLLLTRGFVHPTNATFLTLNFPSRHFGKLFGLVGSFTGVISLLQYVIFQISLDIDPTFFYINLGFLIFAIFTLIHPIAIFIQIRSLSKH